MQKVIMYTKQTCPYCEMAKKLLKSKQVNEIIELRVDLDQTIREEMITKTGRMTVPQIFIGDYHVGGFDDLAKLNQQGQLEPLLKGK